MKHEPIVPTHVTPPPVMETHIHHEEDPTILARWLRVAMETGPIFWGALVVVVVGIGALVFWSSSRAVVGSENVDAWAELAAIGEDQAASIFGGGVSSDVPEQFEELASANPDTLAADFARLQAGTILLREASGELASTRRADGVGKLMEADELFGEVLKSSTDPTIRRIASLGAARSAEARLGLGLEDANRPKVAEVVALYEKVASDFAGSPQASQAKILATRLGDPETIAFYENVAKYDPNALTIPPPGDSGSGLPAGVTLPNSLAPGGSGSLLDMLKGAAPPPLSPSNLPSPLDLPPPPVTPPDEPSTTVTPPTEPPVTPPTEPSPPPVEPPVTPPTEPSPPPVESPAPSPPADPPKSDFPDSPFPGA